MSDALFAARLHLATGTLLSDESMRDICRELVEAHLDRDVATKLAANMTEAWSAERARVLELEAQVFAFGATPLEAVINASLERWCGEGGCVCEGPHSIHSDGKGRMWFRQTERPEDWHRPECLARRAECDTEPCECRPRRGS